MDGSARMESSWTWLLITKFKLPQNRISEAQSLFLRQREKLQFQDFCKSDSAESAYSPPPPRNRFVRTGSCSAGTGTVCRRRSSATGSRTARTGAMKWPAGWMRTQTQLLNATPREVNQQRETLLISFHVLIYSICFICRVRNSISCIFQYEKSIKQ